MHVDAGHFHAGEFCRAGIDLARTADRDAELVRRLAGGNLFMGFCIDIGIDAHRDVCGSPTRRRDRGEQIELRLGFDIDAKDAFIDRQRKLARSLADAGKHDLVGGNPGRPRALEFAFRHHIRAGAEAGERLDHGLVGIRLHGVAHQRAHVGEGRGEHLVMTFKRCRRIAIERRADGRGEVHEIHRLGVKDAGAIGEVVHRGCSVRFRYNEWAASVAINTIAVKVRSWK